MEMMKRPWNWLLNDYRSTEPYYLVRYHLRSEGLWLRRILLMLMIFASVVIVLFAAQQSSITTTLALVPQIIVFVLSGTAIFGVLLVIFLVMQAMSEQNEGRQVDRVAVFMKKEKYDDIELNGIQEMAVVGIGVMAVRTPLPAALFTAVATVVVIGSLRADINFILAEITIVSLLTFADAVLDARLDAVIHKAVIVYRTQRLREQRKLKDEIQLTKLMDLPPINHQTSTGPV